MLHYGVMLDSTHGTHKSASDDEVKLDGSLTQHLLEKQALNVDDDDVIVWQLNRSKIIS